jgi:hypothetical protein
MSQLQTANIHFTSNGTTRIGMIGDTLGMTVGSANVMHMSTDQITIKTPVTVGGDLLLANTKLLYSGGENIYNGILLREDVLEPYLTFGYANTGMVLGYQTAAAIVEPDRVFLAVRIGTTTKGTATGTLRIHLRNLPPMAEYNPSFAFGQFMAGYWNFMSANTSGLNGYIQNSGTGYIDLWVKQMAYIGGPTTDTTHVHLNDSCDMILSGWYLR